MLSNEDGDKDLCHAYLLLTIPTFISIQENWTASTDPIRWHRPVPSSFSQYCRLRPCLLYQWVFLSFPHSSLVSLSNVYRLSLMSIFVVSLNRSPSSFSSVLPIPDTDRYIYHNLDPCRQPISSRCLYSSRLIFIPKLLSYVISPLLPPLTPPKLPFRWLSAYPVPAILHPSPFHDLFRPFLLLSFNLNETVPVQVTKPITDGWPLQQITWKTVYTSSFWCDAWWASSKRINKR